MRHELVCGALLLALLAGLYRLLHESGTLSTIADANALHAQVLRLGPWGPLVIIVLTMPTVLISPIPSAPTALAAGAACGHGWGALYVVLGSGAGALAAFGVARFVGFQAVHRWFGSRLAVGLVGSQNALMAIVLVSRLLPFVSFDIVSYAAGLTVLRLWRFAVATLVGVVPTSFLLAHFGSEMATGETDRILWSVLALGGLTLIPLGLKLVRDWRHGRKRRSRPSE